MAQNLVVAPGTEKETCATATSGPTAHEGGQGGGLLATIPLVADIFVSYSRTRDTDFVDRLADALAARDFECWVDREDIFPSSPWRDEIQQAILEAPTLLFVISSASVSSPYCQAELERAVQLNKRLVPVVVERVPDGSVPTELAELQFIDFSTVTGGDQAAFDAQLELLVTALSTDLESVHFHTRLLTQAERWMGRGADASLLLRGRELTEAEKWMDERVSKRQPVLPQQQRLIRESRQAAIRRQRGSVSVALAIAGVMALLAVLTGLEWHVAVQQRHQAEVQRHQAEVQRHQAEVQRHLAEVQRDRASSLYLAEESQSELSTDPQLALLLGLRGYRYAPTLQAEASVRAAVSQSSLAGVVPAPPGQFDLSPSPFDPSGRWVAFSYPQGENSPALIDVVPVSKGRTSLAGGRHFSLQLPHSYVSWAQFDTTGTHVLAVVKTFPSGVYHLVSWAWRTSPAVAKTLSTVPANAVLNRAGTWLAALVPGSRVVLRPVAGGQPIYVPLKSLGHVSGLAFSPDGNLLAVIGKNRTQIWYRFSKQQPVFDVPGNGTAAFSPDDQKLAIAENGLAIDVLSLPSGKVTVDQATLPTSLAAHCCDVNEVLTLAWSADSTTLAAGTEEDPVVWLWPGPSRAPVYLLYTTEGTGGPLAFSPDGRDLLDGDLLWAWDATIAADFGGQFSDIAFWPGRDAVAGSTSTGGLVLWDWKNYYAYWLVPAPPHPSAVAPFYTDLSFSPNGEYLAATIGDLVQIWSLSDDAVVAHLVLPHGEGWGGAGALAFSPDGGSLVISATASVGPSNHDVVLYWHWRTQVPAARLDLSGDYAYLAGFDHDQARILVTPAEQVNNPSTVLVWDGVSGSRPTVVTRIPQRYDWDEAAALADGQYLLADQAGIALYNPQAKRRTLIFQGYEPSFVLSPTGEAAAITSSTGFVYVWDLHPADAPVLAYKSRAEFPLPAWDGSGTELGLADRVDGLRVMSAVPYLPFAQVLPVAERLAVTTLTPAEKRQFLP